MKKIWFFLLISSTALAQPPGEWTWMKGSTVQNAPGVFGTQGVPNPANTPPAFYEAVEWTDLQGNFWLFGGSDGNMDLYSDLWKYNPASNQWTWMKGPGTPNPPGIYGTQGVPAPTNYPPPRVAGGTWVDASGNLWLCGGGDYFSNPRNDLWRYNITTNQWTWMKGSNTPNAAGIYGTMGVPAPANVPGGRTELGTTWSDNTYLWIFGGYGCNTSSFSTGALSDVWRYNVSTNEWTWMDGTQNINDPPIYGTIGVPNAVNTPGGRYAYTKWKDASNNFWFFGGEDGNSDNYSDLWRYNSGTGMWTWMSGSNLTNQPGIQGITCTPATGNRPVSKYENRVCWIDNCGNMWSCGGADDGGFSNVYNDLWMYNPTSNQWTFINGSMASNVTPVYGTVTVSAPTNRPGGRCGQNAWIDPATGNLFMFGGGIPTFPTCRNDLWRYVPNPTCGGCSAQQPLIVIASNDTAVCSGVCVNISVSAMGGDPPYTYAWTPNVGNGPGPYQVCPNVTTTYYIVVTDSLGITATDSVTITVNQPPVLTTGSPAAVCNGAPATLTVSGASTYTWFPCTNLSPCTGSSVTSTTPTSTSYTVIGIDVNGCADTATYQVNVAPNPTPTITPNGPLEFCVGGSVDLTANPNGTFVWSSGPTTQTVHVTQSGTFTVVVTDVNGCTGTSAPLNVIVDQPPVLSSFANPVLCNGGNNGSVTVNAVGGVPPYAYQWSPSGGTGPTEINLSAGTYTVVVTDSIGCTQSLTDTITEPPAMTLAMGSVNSDCDTFNGQAATIPSGGTPGYTYLWSTGQTASGIFGVAGGVYTVTVTDFNSCMVIDSVLVGVNPGSIPVYIGNDTSIIYGNSVRLFAGGGVHYWWQPSSGLSCSGCPNPVANPLQTTDYCVKVTDSTGCYDTACMRVTVIVTCGTEDGELFVPDAFSPNDDGNNDMLYAYGSGMKEFYFAVYDRWGERVFESTDPRKGWDGGYKGRRLDPAVFIYVLKVKCVGGSEVTKKGNVSLFK